MTTGTSEVESSPLEPGRRVDPRWVVVVGVVVVILGGGVLAWQLSRSDQTFPGGYGMEVRREVGRPVWTSLVPPRREGADEVRITALEPIFETDGAEVEVEYLICELDPDVLSAEGVGGFGYGLHDGAVDRYCSITTPAEGATFELRADPSQELIVGVTPTIPGRTVITGHEIEFREGWRWGSDEIEVEIHVTARRGAG